MVLLVKDPSANAEDLRDSGSISGWKDPLEEGAATHSLGMRRLVGYGPYSRRVRQD